MFIIVKFLVACVPQALDEPDGVLYGLLYADVLLWKIWHERRPGFCKLALYLDRVHGFFGDDAIC